MIQLFNFSTVRVISLYLIMLNCMSESAQMIDYNNTLQAAFTEFARNLNLQMQQDPPGPPGPSGSPGPPGRDGVGGGNGNGNGSSKAEDFGFFNPDYEDKSNSSVVNVGWLQWNFCSYGAHWRWLSLWRLWTDNTPIIEMSTPL